MQFFFFFSLEFAHNVANHTGFSDRGRGTCDGLVAYNDTPMATRNGSRGVHHSGVDHTKKKLWVSNVSSGKLCERQSDSPRLLVSVGGHGLAATPFGVG